jgi:hypothetical protein
MSDVIQKNESPKIDESILNNRKWSFEHDELLSTWADKAACYTWMHDATQRKFRTINMRLGIPVIVLSTISGTANFGISTIFPAGFNYGNAVIGTLSLITGVISTVSNFLGYAQSEEAHRISSIQWSKFKRTIETELSIHPDERRNASEFIKYARSELDRLMEQNPTIPQDIIDKFIHTFKKVKDVKMPENCNKLEPTSVYSKLFENKMSKELLKNNESEINTSDNHIINIVTDKINNLDSKDNVIQYSNEDVILEVNTNKNILTKPEENIKENILTKPEENIKENILTEPEENIKEKTNTTKSKILPKQLIYGKK